MMAPTNRSPPHQGNRTHPCDRRHAVAPSSPSSSGFLVLAGLQAITADVNERLQVAPSSGTSKPIVHLVELTALNMSKSCRPAALTSCHRRETAGTAICSRYQGQEHRAPHQRRMAGIVGTSTAALAAMGGTFAHRGSGSVHLSSEDPDDAFEDPARGLVVLAELLDEPLLEVPDVPVALPRPEPGRPRCSGPASPARRPGPAPSRPRRARPGRGRPRPSTAG